MTALPVPILTATIDDRGRVKIAGASTPSMEGRANRLLTCGKCGARGHARNNRRFHPRST